MCVCALVGARQGTAIGSQITTNELDTHRASPVRAGASQISPKMCPLLVVRENRDGNDWNAETIHHANPAGMLSISDSCPLHIQKHARYRGRMWFLIELKWSTKMVQFLCDRAKQNAFS